MKDGESGTAKEKKEKADDTPSVVVVQPIEKALKTKVFIILCVS